MTKAKKPTYTQGQVIEYTLEPHKPAQVWLEGTYDAPYVANWHTIKDHGGGRWTVPSRRLRPVKT